MATEAQILNAVLASIGDAVVATDTQGRVLNANPAAQKLLRARKDQVVGRPLGELFHAEEEQTPDAVESPVARLLAGAVGGGMARNTVLVTRNGTPVPMDASASPVRDETGTIRGAILVFRDKTEADRLDEARRLLACIVESSDDAIISKTLDGIVTSWNQSAEKMFGYSAQEMIGKPISTIMPADRSEDFGNILEKIRRGERITHYETVRVTKGGTRLHVSLSISPVRDASGRIVGVSKISRDITPQIRARMEMADQRELLRVTLRSIGDAVVATDGSGAVTFMNPVAEELTGWRSSDAAGRPLDEVFRIVNEETRVPAENPTSKVLREGRVVGLANHTVLIDREGRERAIDDSAAPIRGQDGQLLGVIMVFRDVSGQREVELRLKRQSDELRRANDDLSQFAYAISHDLREPLRNVFNFTELLVREGTAGNVHAPDYAKYVFEGVTHMEMLLNDLLAYSQLDTHSEYARRITDSNEVLRSTIESLQSTIAETETTVSSDRLPLVWVNPAHLAQLFQNLLGNAIKYRYGSAPRVHFRAQRSGHEWLFSVRDNGVGIAPEFHRSIFGVFRRLHTKEIPGTGIGLAICSKIVEKHGGRIWVESTPGQGAEFFFTLPAVEPESRPDQAAADPSR